MPELRMRRQGRQAALGAASSRERALRDARGERDVR
jgi:hypothetical protein